MKKFNVGDIVTPRKDFEQFVSSPPPGKLYRVIPYTQLSETGEYIGVIDTETHKVFYGWGVHRFDLVEAIYDKVDDLL